jgi:hypothetical protein
LPQNIYGDVAKSLPWGADGLVEYVALASANSVTGFYAGSTQFGVPYVEFTASEAVRGQVASFRGGDPPPSPHWSHKLFLLQSTVISPRGLKVCDIRPSHKSVLLVIQIVNINLNSELVYDAQTKAIVNGP